MATAEVSSLVAGDDMAPGRVPAGWLRVDLVPTSNTRPYENVKSVSDEWDLLAISPCPELTLD